MILSPWLRHFCSRLLILATIIGLFLPALPLARAVDVSQSTFLNNYYYNSLISDQDFIDIASMSEDSIQSFLEQTNSYLAQYSQNDRRAARIIYDAAHGSGDAAGTLNGIVINSATGTISPRLLLVTLQKEQSLITLTSSDRDANIDQYNNRLQRAMGYGCPDGGGCDDKYAGFTKQVEWAAWQLRYNYERAQGHGFSDYQVNQTQSFSGNGVIYSVTMTNRATAALYRYTPHVFNGNYNVWKLFNTWFTASSTAPPPAPPSVNDTSEVSVQTFKDKFKAEGAKDLSTNVFFDGKGIAGGTDSRWTIEFTPQVGKHDYTIEYRDSGGTVVGTKKITIDRHTEGDINGDAKVDLLDLSLLGQSFGQGVPDSDWRNLNPDVDSEVNILDISIMAAKWGG